jgi:hypothetical protein
VFYALSGSSGVISTTAVDSTYVNAHSSAARAKGGFENVIGRSRGGRTTKVHAVTNDIGRPVAFTVTAR